MIIAALGKVIHDPRSTGVCRRIHGPLGVFAWAGYLGPTKSPPMNPILRNVLAVIVGVAACMLLNGFLLAQMLKLVPPPVGFPLEDMSTYEAKHFLSPFIAHAVPSLVGGFLAALIAATRKMTFALVVGAVHLLGGIMAAFMIPAPVWFIVLDLVVAYIPMAWIGGKLARA